MNIIRRYRFLLKTFFIKKFINVTSFRGEVTLNE